MSSVLPEFFADGHWICERCNVLLEQIKVPVFYLNSAFDVVLPRCPKCGFTLVPKSLAEGKMLEVETLLEDK
ncbi:MAG: DNA-binding protein [Desulfovibrio sp.]|nr:DNA-binding protein [Desulfovibrio sp.]